MTDYEEVPVNTDINGRQFARRSTHYMTTAAEIRPDGSVVLSDSFNSGSRTLTVRPNGQVTVDLPGLRADAPRIIENYNHPAYASHVIAQIREDFRDRIWGGGEQNDAINLINNAPPCLRHGSSCPIVN